MIRDIAISAKGAGDDQYYEPPACVLSLAVIGGDAYLAIYKHGPKKREGEPVACIEVPARSPGRNCRERQQTANRRQHPQVSTPPATSVSFVPSTPPSWPQAAGQLQGCRGARRSRRDRVSCQKARQPR